MHSAEIHSRISWPATLERLGIGVQFLTNRHGPCPVCGGRDRFRFDNRFGRGDFYCSGCGPGDGFALVMRFHGVDFARALQFVRDAACIAAPIEITATKAARATTRVTRLLASAVSPASVPAAVAYLGARGVWPLPDGCSLEAVAAVEVWDSTGEQPVSRGQHPALVARVLDSSARLVTLHCTYLTSTGTKLEPTPRKLLGAVRERIGCAVQLVPQRGAVLGIAEGIETALAVIALHDLPCWAATNAGLLAKFEPPEGVRRVIVFADRDRAGLDAAAVLVRRLRGRVAVEIRTPQAPAKDFCNVLASRVSTTSTEEVRP